MKIYYFTDKECLDKKISGGKAANLARLVKLGYNVPEGFVLCGIKSAAEIDRAKMIEAFDALNVKAVSVRSSAAGEDGKNKSFAGQYKSRLFVDRQNLIAAVLEVYESKNLSRADKYGGDSDFCVIVQKMIDSDYSGVCFSSVPGGGAIIETVKGTGEKLVSGNSTPELINLPKEDGVDIVSKYADSRIIKEIADAAAELEKKYRTPVDIEWAVKQERLYFLQVRPLTGIYKDNKKTDGTAREIMSGRDWEFYVYRRFAFLAECAQKKAGAAALQNKLFGFDLAVRNYLVINGSEYLLTGDNNKVNEKFDGLFERDREFFKKFADRIFKIIYAAADYKNRLGSIDFCALSDEELLAEFKRFEKVYINVYVPSMMRPDSYLEKKLKKSLTDEFGGDAGALYAALTVCSAREKTFYAEERKEFLELVKAVKNGKITGAKLDALLDSHKDKFGWLKNPLGYEFTEFSREDYSERLGSLIGGDINGMLENIERVRRGTHEKRSKALERIKNCGIVMLAEAVSEFILLRTFTSENADLLFFTARKTLFNEIARRLNTGADTVAMSGFNEIKSALRNKSRTIKLEQAVKKRTGGMAFVWLDGKFLAYYGANANLLELKLLPITKSAAAVKSGIIKGSGANPGRAEGIARVVENFSDAGTLKKGEILVTNMTTPDLMLAMDKAAAFVTDEGGITCHAAILSREYNVPCVVGTVNGTKVIKSGDFVEVDAFSGIVNIKY